MKKGQTEPQAKVLANAMSPVKWAEMLRALACQIESAESVNPDSSFLIQVKPAAAQTAQGWIQWTPRAIQAVVKKPEKRE